MKVHYQEVIMRTKKSKIKYTLGSIDHLCPECHKLIEKQEKFYVPCNIDKWGDNYINVCPKCKYKFDNAKLLIFPHIEHYLSDCNPIIKTLLDYTTDISINANDFFGFACADGEEFDCEMIGLYFELTFNEKMDPKNTLEALMEWHRGYLRCEKKLPSKELRQIRKLTGWKWYPKPKED